MKNLLYALVADRVRGLENIDRTNHFNKRQRQTEMTVATYELALEILGPWADDLTECYPVEGHSSCAVRFPLREIDAALVVIRHDKFRARVAVEVTYPPGSDFRCYLDGLEVDASTTEPTKYNPPRARLAIEGQLAGYCHKYGLGPRIQPYLDAMFPQS